MPQSTLLSALAPSKDDHTIHVRVGRIWEAINKKTNTLLHTNVILLDEQEDHIVATIRNNQKQIFLPLLKEQSVCSVTNFKVVPGPALYRSVDKDNAINFFYKTKIEQISDMGVIPRYKFELQPFNQVQSLVGQLKCLIDVIGMVLSYGHLEKRSNGAEKMDIVLINERKEKIVVTLWEERAYQFQTAVAEIQHSALFVVITGLIAKKFSDKASLSSSDATRSYFNIDYKPLHDLRDAIVATTGQNINSLAPPTNKQFVSVDESTVQEVDVKSVLEMKLTGGKDVVRCLCKGTITEILNGNGWYYNCCTKCARAARLLEGKYYCSACTEDDIPITQRYRVVVRIQDESGTTTLTLFNKEAEQLIGVPLQNVLADLAENSTMAEIPTVLKNIVDKQCAFQIKITSYNMTHGCEEYTVTRVSDCTTPVSNNSDEPANMKKKQKLH